MSRSPLLQKFKEHWVKSKFASPDQTVLLAVSGGEDSMVMAHLFYNSKLRFAVAHCNFGLRGSESDLDEDLVRAWCSEHGITFHRTKFDTKIKAAEWKTGTQETARILRYEWFEQLRKEFQYGKIVTAHHANDNVETLMINLFKGTGISGLHGILPKNGTIIRPLLFAEKDLIKTYSLEHQVGFREDASNASDDYLRNAVRHNIVPIVQQLFPNAVNNVNESITRFGEAEQLYKKAIEAERKKLIEQRGQDHYIPVRKLRNHQPLATICYELLLPFGFTSGQVADVIRLLSSETGHYVASQTHRVIRNRDFLIITSQPAETADLVSIEGVPCLIDTGKFQFEFSIQNKPANIPVSPDEAWIDMKYIEFPLVLRKWRTGDYMYPLGMKMKKKKVSRLLIDVKTPLHEKDDLRILECSTRIAWVSGIRLDERFKISDHTERVLLIKRQLK